MAKEKFEQSKSHVDADTIGHVDHGKATLTATSIITLTKKLGGAAKAYDQTDNAPEEKAHGVAINTSYVEHETETRRYVHVDCPGHADRVKSMITGVVQMNDAILVCSATDGPIPQIREHILLARQVGVSCIIVFMNECDTVDSAELLGLIEMETRDLPLSYDFPGNDCPTVQGSALKVLEGDTAYGKEIFELAIASDSYIPTPERAVDKPFLLPIESVFSISGYGTVVTDRVERGVIHVGDEIEIIDLKETQKATYIGAGIFHRLLDEGQAGSNVGILLRGTKRERVERGRVLARSGTITPHTKSKARVYILSKEEGGRHIPFFVNYRPQFYFHTTDVTDVVTLEEGVEMAVPDENVAITVELITPIAMEEGLRFAIREGGRTVGAGVVSSIVV